MNGTSLEISLRHSFGGFTLNADFTAPPGVTALFGRSGSGKTTLVNAVAGLLRPDAGRVVVGGEVLFDSAKGIHLAPHERRVGYVFQEGRLFPHLNVRANLCYGRRFAPGAPDEKASDHIVELLGISALLNRRPSALSGGEKQRVAIGRALLSRPRLLLMDEPLAALDEARKSEILPYLERIRDEAQVPVLYVSHSVAEVARLATSLVVMHDGKVLASGPAEQVMSDPAAIPAFGPSAVGSLLQGRLSAHHDDGLSEISIGAGALFLPNLPGGIGQGVRVRVEAQDVMLSLDRPTGISALNVLPVTVRGIAPGEGPTAMVELALEDQRLLSRVTKRSVAALGLAPGRACFAVVKSVSVARDEVGAA